MYTKPFIILCGLTSILREAEAGGCPKEEFDALVVRIDEMLETAVDFANDEDELLGDEEYVPSFAHVGGEDGVVKDLKQGTGLCNFIFFPSTITVAHLPSFVL